MMYKELTDLLFEQREQNISHISYEQELMLFSSIRKGRTEQIPQIVDALKSNHTSRLSQNPIQNLRYLFVVSIAQICRFAIEGGVNMEKAFCISDLFIQKMDVCLQPDDIYELYRQALTCYAEEVQYSHKKELHYSSRIRQSIDYIYNHLHEKLNINILSSRAGLSPNYYSSLFKKETGTTVSAYINKARISAACNMLHYSEYSGQEISDYLGFSSYSHFCSIFKKYTFQTPLEYRRTHFRKKW